jgi:hypothetical protein
VAIQDASMTGAYQDPRIVAAQAACQEQKGRLIEAVLAPRRIRTTTST